MESEDKLYKRVVETYKRRLHELEHPKPIDFEKLKSKIKSSCRKIGLPPIKIYMTDRDDIRYAPVDGIVRESSLPEPKRIDRHLDVAYLMMTRPETQFARAHIEFCMSVGSEINLDDITEPAYWSIASVHINVRLFDHEMQNRFRGELGKKGLLPENTLRDFGMASLIPSEEERLREASIKPRYTIKDS